MAGKTAGMAVLLLNEWLGRDKTHCLMNHLLGLAGARFVACE